jgi:hypothetical protein
MLKLSTWTIWSKESDTADSVTPDVLTWVDQELERDRAVCIAVNEPYTTLH